MENNVVWGIHTGRPRGSKESEQRVLVAEMDRIFKGAGGRGTIAIGWPAIGDLRDLPEEQEAIKLRLAEILPEATPQVLTNDAATLRAFAAEASEGDIVVWRSPETRDVWIGHIRGPYAYEPDAHQEYVHRRTVSWRPPQDASDFSKEALRSLSQQRSFFRVKNDGAEFRQASSGMPDWMVRASAAAAAATATTAVSETETP